MIFTLGSEQQQQVQKKNVFNLESGRLNLAKVIWEEKGFELTLLKSKHAELRGLNCFPVWTSAAQTVELLEF